MITLPMLETDFNSSSNFSCFQLLIYFYFPLVAIVFMSFKVSAVSIRVPKGGDSFLTSLFAMLFFACFTF